MVCKEGNHNYFIFDKLPTQIISRSRNGKIIVSAQIVLICSKCGDFKIKDYPKIFENKLREGR